MKGQCLWTHDYNVATRMLIEFLIILLNIFNIVVWFVYGFIWKWDKVGWDWSDVGPAFWFPEVAHCWSSIIIKRPSINECTQLCCTFESFIEWNSKLPQHALCIVFWIFYFLVSYYSPDRFQFLRIRIDIIRMTWIQIIHPSFTFPQRKNNGFKWIDWTD